ncbi:hypothetical protein T439DRAFT_320925 [Meredithblackwellia eburnea MCA 4105]
MTTKLAKSASSLAQSCSCQTRRLFSSSTAPRSLPDSLPLHRNPASLDPKQLPSTAPSPLSILASQPSHYITALLLGRRYLLTTNDILTVPKLKGVKPGDVLALTRILELGSRDYTLRPAVPLQLEQAEGEEGGNGGASAKSAALKANSAPLLTPVMSRSVVRPGGIPRDWQRHPDSLPALDQAVVQATLTVLEHTKGKMFEVEKFKRRKGYRRKLKSKLGFTKLRVGDIILGEEQV